MIPYGSLVVFVTPKGRRYIKLLEEGKDWHGNDGVLRAADVALYRAKELGRARIVSFGMLEAG